METDINKRSTYQDTFGHVYEVDFNKTFLKGGQGVVVRTTESDLALKIIIDSSTKECILDDSNNDKYLDIRILPIPDDLHITLPQATIKGMEGYVMILLNDMEEFQKSFSLNNCISKEDDEQAKKIKDFCKNNSVPENLEKKIMAYANTGGVRRRMIAYMKAAAILARLHAHGLVYCDFSDKNVFISSQHDYSQVWFIDADNLDYSERYTSNKRGGFYTPGYSAPEIICGQGTPSFYSDSFSFGVALFSTLFVTHPYNGDAYNADLDTADDSDEVDLAKDRGDYPWILDRDDESNDGSNRMIFPSQFIITKDLEDLFNQCFSENGKFMPESRPSMMNWAYNIAYAYDNLVYSSSCGLEYMANENNTVCPFDDSNTKVVKLKSFYVDENDNKLGKIWQFTHEITAEITVPLRIIKGFYCQDIEDDAFVLKFDGKELAIQPMMLDYNFLYKDSVATTELSSYGYFVTKEKNFSVKCIIDKENIILIEGEFNG